MDEVWRRNLSALRKRASTHTDGGMLWCVPPTLASLTLKVEKSKTRPAHHAPESSPLLHTCIFSRNILLPCELVALCRHREFPPENPEKQEDLFSFNGEIDTQPCWQIQLFSLRGCCGTRRNRLSKRAESTAERDIQSAAARPRRTVRYGARSLAPRLHRQVKSAQALRCDRAECAPCAEWRSGGGKRPSNDAALWRARLLFLSDVTSLLSLTLLPPFPQLT